MTNPILKLFLGLLLLTSLIGSYGCASKFKTINLESFNYTDSKVKYDSLRVSYVKDIQTLADNRRYAAKEKAKGLMSVGVKIENLSSQTINLTPTNFEVSTVAGKKTILSADAYAKKIKQRVGLHLLHSLWGPWSLTYQESNSGETNVSFIYIPIGLIVGLGNAIRASNANKSNLEAHQKYTIWGKAIKPGETVYGLVPIQIKKDESIQFTYQSKMEQAKATNLIKINGSYAPPLGNIKSAMYDYYVAFQNKAYSIKAKIDTHDKVHCITTKINDVLTVIKPSDTRFLSRYISGGVRIDGVPADSCWLFPVIKGRITAYYFLPETSHKYISHIQKGNDPIVAFSPENLKAMTEFDEEVDELIYLQKYSKAIVKFNKKH